MTHFEVNYFEVRFLFLRNSHFRAKNLLVGRNILSSSKGKQSENAFVG